MVVLKMFIHWLYIFFIVMIMYIEWRYQTSDIKWLHKMLFFIINISPVENQYNKYTTVWLLTKKPLYDAKMFYWPVNSSSIYCPLSIINKTSRFLGLDGQESWKHLIYIYMWVERVIIKKKILKKENILKKVIDWLLGEQQFCLTLERPSASGNRSVLGSNRTTVFLEPN